MQTESGSSQRAPLVVAAAAWAFGALVLGALTPLRGGPEATAAVEAADRAQRGWAATAPRVRSEILRNCFQTLIEHTDELGTLITLIVTSELFRSQ